MNNDPDAWRVTVSFDKQPADKDRPYLLYVWDGTEKPASFHHLTEREFRWLRESMGKIP